MSERIAIVGGTGVYARHLVPRLVDAGFRVRALARKPEAATTAAAAGCEVVAADMFDEPSLVAALSGCDVAVNLATSLPAPGRSGGDYAQNDLLRREGTKNFVRACATAGVTRVVQQSIAMTHANGDAWADETTFQPVDEQTVAGAAVAAVRAMEDVVQTSGLDWLVLRGGLFYGPGTGFDDDWFSRARAGKLRLPAEGADYVSLVHIADMAAATVAAIHRWPSRQALIVADDSPAPWRDVLHYVAAIAGAAPPATGGLALMPSFRVRNGLAKELLQWRPFHRDWRTGLVR